VVIRRSSAPEVSALLRDLASGTGPERETAVARLSVIGTRAVAGLLALLASDAGPAARAGALSALEAIADPRAADAALHALEADDEGVRGAAAALLRRLLDSTRGAAVLDGLAAIAVDAARPDGARVAALEALRQVPGSALSLISARLADDPSLAVRAMVVGAGNGVVLPPLDALERAANGTLPDDPDSLRQWLAAAGPHAPLPTLHRLVQRVREREAAEAPRRGEWMTARAAAHQALAARGSTVALYDLRETIEAGEGAPVEMLAALEAVGDRTCLEPIAAACARQASPPGHAATGPDAGAAAWWRGHLVAAFRTIVAREHLTERHAVIRRVRARWPETAAALLGSRK
jgi:hypothetical protein